MTKPAGFSRAQIAPHWIVAALVVAQYLFKDAIAEAWRLMLQETPPLRPAHPGPWAGGALILALVVWRLVLRACRGVPPPPEHEPALLKRAAGAAHVAPTPCSSGCP
ncbi:MAG: hypothetical protein R3D59_06620 [Paracoccaceae bacterium]